MLADIFTTSKFGKSVKNVTGKFKFSDIHYMTYYFGTNIILIGQTAKLTLTKVSHYTACVFRLQ